MSRPIIGRDWTARTRVPRTLEEAFGVRHGLDTGRRRRVIDADWLVGVVFSGVLAALLAALGVGLL